MINTDNGLMTTWVSGADYRVVAVHGTDGHRPRTVLDQAVVVTAGGRVDLEVVVPAGGAGSSWAGTRSFWGTTPSTLLRSPHRTPSWTS